VQPPPQRPEPLRVLFLVSAHNGLSHRASIALRELGHEVAVAVVDSPAAMKIAVRQHDPDVIVCPFLTQPIPESIRAKHRCLVVHPGPVGDRGPSSLDWAIELGEREWGVTIREADGETDAGAIYATRTFPVRDVGKSSLYRHEVRHAAIEALTEAIAKLGDGSSRPTPLDSMGLELIGRARPPMTQETRAIHWKSDLTEDVLRAIRAGEGSPGVLDEIGGIEFHLFGAHPERTLHGHPGEIVATRHGAICRATADGAVWITHLKRRDRDGERYFKLPAVDALALAGHELEVPEVPVAPDAPLSADETYREIRYQEHGQVGYLQFDFYNGAMSSAQCRRLLDAYLHARSQPQTKVIVLTGGSDHFSNGIDLNVIEAAEDPAAESWQNLETLDALVLEILGTDTHLVISALGGDTAAGGVPLALAADFVVAREDVVLKPSCQHLGGLPGSRYWTYLLARRPGAELTERLTAAPFTPVGAQQAVRIGLLDGSFGANLSCFCSQVRSMAEDVAREPAFEVRLEQKHLRRERDERIKPLRAYGSQELALAQRCVFGPDAGYHEARRRFVYKLGPDCAPAAPAAASVAA
jgi:putative two-component system hydrogenase maturation factor HypX/HoxX